jgi:hypothetical protein
MCGMPGMVERLADGEFQVLQERQILLRKSTAMLSTGPNLVQN